VRVAFLTPEFPTESHFAGGLASYLRRVTRAFAAAGHEAEVFTLSHVQERIWDGPTLVHRVQREHRLQAVVNKIPYVGRAAGYVDIIVPAWNLAAALYRRHRELPFDAVQASNYRACGLVAALRNSIPVVTRISSYEPAWRAMYRRPLTRRQRHIERAELLQVRWSAVAYAPSLLLAEIFKTREGVDVRVIEPPFSLEPTAPALPVLCENLPAGGYALFFGSLGYLKGCDRLVKVLPELLDRIPDLKFVFIGPVSRTSNVERFDHHIRQKLAAYLDTRVFILEEQRHPALLPLIERARLVVLPSRIDNLPNACMEAMALNRVVIGTRGASFEQLIQHCVNGFLVSQEDDDELTSTIARVWRMDPEERNGIGRRAAQALERLRPHNAVRSLIQLLEEITATKPRGILHRLGRTILGTQVTT
jgi:glycosyltransferase involved in cell wall biosynthesis